jgi:hypothetical protein
MLRRILGLILALAVLLGGIPAATATPSAHDGKAGVSKLDGKKKHKGKKKHGKKGKKKRGKKGAKRGKGKKGVAATS